MPRGQVTDIVQECTKSDETLFSEIELCSPVRFCLRSCLVCVDGDCVDHPLDNFNGPHDMFNPLVRSTAEHLVGLAKLIDLCQPLEGGMINHLQFFWVEPYKPAHGEKKLLSILETRG